MAPFGYIWNIWLHMAKFGYLGPLWLQMALFGYFWLYGSIWLYLGLYDLYGSIWLYYLYGSFLVCITSMAPADSFKVSVGYLTPIFPQPPHGSTGSTRSTHFRLNPAIFVIFHFQRGRLPLFKIKTTVDRVERVELCGAACSCLEPC